MGGLWSIQVGQADDEARIAATRQRDGIAIGVIERTTPVMR
jgi:hypothetical protein